MRPLALWVTLAWAAVAAAEPARVRLRYARDAGAERCPDERTVRGRVVLRLGYDPFDDAAAPEVVVKLAAAGRSLRATIELRDARGDVVGAHQLTLRDPGCDGLAAAMVLALGIAIDPLRGASEPAAPPLAPAATPPPPRSDDEESPAAPPPPPRPAARLRALGAFGAFAAIGEPSSWGLRGGLGLSWRELLVTLELRGDLPTSQSAAGGNVSSSLLLATLLPCVHVQLFVGCALVTAGMVVAYGTDTAVDAQVHPFVGAGARLALLVPLGPDRGLLLHGDLIGALTPASVEVGGTRVLLTPPLSGAVGFQLFAYWR